MFSENDAVPAPLAENTPARTAAPTGACPVIWAYAEGLRGFLPPYLTRDLASREAAIAASLAPLSIQMRRASHLLQYVVKSCLPEGFDMFQLSEPAAKLRALPDLDTQPCAQEYHDAVAALNASSWNLVALGPKTFKAAVLKPLANTERALAHLIVQEPAPIGVLLAPALERTGSLADMFPLLDNLLSIGTEGGPPLALLGRAKLSGNGGLTFF